jgi:hypothetical protein
MNFGKKQELHLMKFSTLSAACRLLAATTVAAIALAACSSGPKIFTNQSPTANFNTYKTYNYESALGTDESNGYRSILSDYLIAATDREMQARGYSKSDTPDMVLNFYVHTKEKIRTTSSPSMGMGGGYYGYRDPYYGSYGGYETRTTQYTEGTLNVDIVDNQKDQLAWEGVAVGRVNDEVRKNLEAAANSAIGEVFAQFPHTAPGFVPPQPAEGS